MIEVREHPINILKNRYPRLLLPIREELWKTDLYRNVVNLGQPVPSDEVEFNFILSEKDHLTVESFTCGEINILFLYERKDFVSFVQKTAYRCEPKEIPNSMGAITIYGLNNLEKINNFLKGNNTYNSDFFNNKDNYQDSIIVLSQGFYSGLDAAYTAYSEEEWLEISLQIRKFHELTHYLCRKKFSTIKNPLLDEIFADCMGIIMAVGKYEENIAKCVLGIDQNEYKKGMRLENYITDGEEIKQSAEKMRQFILKLKEMTTQMPPHMAEFEQSIDFYYPKAASIYAEIFP